MVLKILDAVHALFEGGKNTFLRLCVLTLVANKVSEAFIRVRLKCRLSGSRAHHYHGCLGRPPRQSCLSFW